MKELLSKLYRNLPLLLLVLVEFIIGVMLFVNPESVTKIAILIFGAILLLIGVIHLVRYFRLKQQGVDNLLTLIIAIVNLTLGLILVIFPNGMVTLIKGILGVVFILYGIGMIIGGVYKIILFLDLRKGGFPVSWLTLAAGALSLVFGVIILINFKSAEEIMWRVAGISLIVEGVFDSISLLMNLKRTNP